MPDIELTQLPIPDAALSWLKSADPEQEIFEHRISIDPDWWTRELKPLGLPPDAIAQDSITRRDLFEMAEAASNDPDVALRFLLNVIAWGSGTSVFRIKQRLNSIAEDRDAAGLAIQKGIHASREDREEAYRLFSPRGRLRIKFLGPAFFTKVLYFAGGGSADHPCLILDRRVALALREAKWETLPTWGWSAPTYNRYCELLERWRDDCGISRADLIERWLFDSQA